MIKGAVEIQRALCPVLIGREDELSAVEDALLAANRGHGRLVLLGGDAGLGKTRLGTELRRRAARLGMTTLWGACPEAELSVPYLPFVEAIGNYLSRPDSEDIRSRLGAASDELAALFPQLRSQRSVIHPVDPHQAKLRLFESIVALLRLAAGTTGLLFVVEDLQWADPSTRELLDYVSRRLGEFRTLLLGTYRRDEIHRKHPLLPLLQGWRRTGLGETIELRPLDGASMATMIQAILDTEPVSRELQDLLIQRSEGNPFVLEEMLRAGLDRGDLLRTASGWQRVATSPLELPQTLSDTVLLRLERLKQPHQHILKVASVLGQTFKYEILVRVADQPEPSVVAALATCIDHQLLVEADGSPRRYQFRHALTREAIYGELIGPERDRLHLRAAMVLKTDPDTAPADLAHHLVAAQQWDEALPACLKAAEQALRTSAFGDAVELYERVLPHIDDALLRARVLCQLGFAQYYATALATRALPYLEQGIESLEQMGHAREAARYRLILGRCYWEDAQPEPARAQYELVRIRLEPEGPSGDLAMAYVRLAAMHEYQAVVGAAISMAGLAIDVAARARADEPRIEAEMYMAMAGTGREASAQLLRTYREALEQGLDEIALRSLVNANLRDILEYRALAIPARRHLFEPLRTGGFEKVEPLVQSGQLAWLRGDVPEALDRLEEVRSHPLLQGTFRRWIEMWLVAVYAELGRFEDSRRMIPRKEGLERQDAWQLAVMAIPGRLAAGDLEWAVGEATELWKRRDEGDPSTEKSWLFDAAVEALIAGDKLAPARDLVVNGRLNPGVDGHNPHQDRAEGRLALAEGRLSDAIGSLRAAADFFAAAGYRLEEARNRRTLAEALIRSGDAAGGE